MTNILGLKRVKEVDSKINYMIGYRQFVNFAFMLFGVWMFESGAVEVGAIIFVLGLRSFASQFYHNVDALEVMESVKRDA